MSSDANIDKYNERFFEELTQAQQLFTASRAQEEAAQDAAVEAQRQKRQAFIGAGQHCNRWSYHKRCNQFWRHLQEYTRSS